MLQHFWQQWQREYLHQLHQRHKWRASSVDIIAKDALVVIQEDNQPPFQWRLDRIELHTGADSVTLRTTDGIIKRPVTKLCMLPIEGTTNQTEHNEGVREGSHNNVNIQNLASQM